MFDWGLQAYQGLLYTAASSAAALESGSREWIYGAVLPQNMTYAVPQQHHAVDSVWKLEVDPESGSMEQFCHKISFKYVIVVATTMQSYDVMLIRCRSC